MMMYAVKRMPPDELRHSDDSLQHYGIKGQKWGQRKSYEYSEGSGAGGGGSESDGEREYIERYNDLKDRIDQLEVPGAKNNALKQLKKIPEDPSNLSPDAFSTFMKMMGELNAYLNQVEDKMFKNADGGGKAAVDKILAQSELMHYGITGQKWGVRRFENEDGTLTEEGKKRYSKMFAKEMAKQKKLERNADLNAQKRLNAIQTNKAKTAAKVGTALAVGAATAGLGYNADIAKKISDIHNKNKIRWLPGTWQSYGDFMGNYLSPRSAYRVTPLEIQAKAGKIATIVGGAAAVAYGKAAYHAVRATVAKKRMTDIGHEKAVAQAKAHLDQMKEMFANTPYAELIGG